MRIAVLLFARYAELAGRRRVEIDVPRGATLARVWERVREEVPALREEASPLLACDRSFARPDRPITGAEEIAVFPPVSGG